MSLVIVLLCIVLLIVLISYFKINAFLSFLIVSILAGLVLGMKPEDIPIAVQKGLGDMLGSITIVIVTGAMLGKLVAESGAAQRIASGMMTLFGEKNVNWALMITGFVIGIPLFYNVGFVLVIPLVFSVAYQYKLPAVATGVPMMAALSVTHGFLPPHPSPTALVADFQADMGTTLFYGLIIAIPTSIIAGPLFSKMVRGIHSKPLETFTASPIPEEKLPSLTNALLSSLSPVILLGLTTILKYQVTEPGTVKDAVGFFSDPAVVMLISLGIATCTLGLNMKMNTVKVMGIYAESVKDITILLLIISGAGSLKEILVQSGVSAEIAASLEGLNMNPLFLGWFIAAFIRVCLGSATVAGITAAKIVAPVVLAQNVNPELMVLSVGAGSLMFSHVNDTGFWMFKEYFNLSIKDTIRSWSLMETIVSVLGLLGVLLLSLFL